MFIIVVMDPRSLHELSMTFYEYRLCGLKAKGNQIVIQKQKPIGNSVTLRDIRILKAISRLEAFD